jgi:hypothetical protein
MDIRPILVSRDEKSRANPSLTDGQSHERMRPVLERTTSSQEMTARPEWSVIARALSPE